MRKTTTTKLLPYTKQILTFRATETDRNPICERHEEPMAQPLTIEHVHEIGVAAGTALSAMFMVAGCIYAVFAIALHLLALLLLLIPATYQAVQVPRDKTTVRLIEKTPPPPPPPVRVEPKEVARVVPKPGACAAPPAGRQEGKTVREDDS